MKVKVALLLLLLLGALAPALAASLLPNGEQTFVDANGQPYAAGKVYFYTPGTLTPKTTWRDSGQTVANANPVVLDSAGRALIYGNGTYRQVLKDLFGNTIWDQLTQSGGGGGSVSPVNATITGSTTVASCSGTFPINNTSGAPITITMPSAPADGDACQFLDVGANASTYAVRLLLGSNVMNTGGSSYYMNSSGMAATMIWVAGPAVWTVN